MLLTAAQRVYSENTTAEWAIGPLTKHRLMVVVYVFTLTLLLMFVTKKFWSDTVQARSILEQVWVAGHYLWLAGFMSCMLGLLGLLLYRKKPLTEIRPIPNLVVFRIVSYGANASTLLHTIASYEAVMKKHPLFPYLIEVVTEEGVMDKNVIPMAQFSDRVSFVEVPSGYETPNKTGWKARALHFILHASGIPDNAWIFHGDEESRFTESAAMGGHTGNFRGGI